MFKKKDLYLLWWRYDFLIANCWNMRCKRLSITARDFNPLPANVENMVRS